MASLAEKRMEDAEENPVDQIRRRGPRNCGCWKRCCLPPPSRSIRRRSPSGCPRASTSRRAGAAAGGIRLARRQSGPRRQQVDLPHRGRSVVADDARKHRNPRLSRAAIEMLAIIAYHQPVTRAEIEEIRGVVTSKGTLDVLLETGWIRPRGRRKTPGRPLTFGTTEAFLSQFSLEALGDLPGLEELKGTGLLDSRLPPGFSVPTPSDDPALREDEDPLEAGDTSNWRWRRRPSRKPSDERQLSPKAGATRSGAGCPTGLTVATIRSRDSDLPRLKSLFLTPPAPRFRQSLGRVRPSRVWRVAGWVR